MTRALALALSIAIAPLGVVRAQDVADGTGEPIAPARRGVSGELAHPSAGADGPGDAGAPASADAVEDGPSSDADRPCLEGRVRVEGRCCWPGQHWSADEARCEGAPECPGGLVEHGEACIQAVALGIPPTSYTGTPRTSTPGAATSTAGWPIASESPDRPRARVAQWRGEDEGLIILALAIFDAGQWIAWIGGVVEAASRACGIWIPSGAGFSRRNCQSWPLSFIPVAGTMTASLMSFDGTRNDYPALTPGILSIILEGTALLFLMPIAFANETTEMTHPALPDETSAVRATIVPAAAGADVGGLSLHLEF